MQRLVAEPRFTEIIGADVSARATSGQGRRCAWTSLVTANANGYA